MTLLSSLKVLSGLLESVLIFISAFNILLPGQFQCSHGRKCIDRKQVCDGIPQCPDNSDESTCWKPTRSCALRCDQNRLCIPEVFICNGIRDCWDGSDETDCGESAFWSQSAFAMLRANYLLQNSTIGTDLMEMVVGVWTHGCNRVATFITLSSERFITAMHFMQI